MYLGGFAGAKPPTKEQAKVQQQIQLATTLLASTIVACKIGEQTQRTLEVIRTTGFRVRSVCGIPATFSGRLADEPERR
jgi:hypothetical protein